MSRLSEGTYTVTVAGAFMTESSKGTLGIAFKFTCPDGDIECTRWVTPATSERVLADLETLGFGQEQLSEVDNLDRIQEITLGNECSIVVENEEYQGNSTPKVKWINKSGARKVSNPMTKAGLFAILKGQTPPPRLVSQPRAPRSEPAPFAPDDDASVPF